MSPVSFIKKVTFITLAATLSNTVFANTVPGNIPAEFAVSGGAATYSIPIDVAPGRGGVQPSLSLNYSSNSGNGIIGMGWSLGGLSIIVRCGRTHAQDSSVGGIYFNENDRFCLDGQRLVPIDGQNGAVGTEYRTELNSYARIISRGGRLGHPEYWEVQTKAGQTMTFGEGGSSRIFTGEGALSWAIREITDSTGNNTIVYTYNFNNNVQHLGSIAYPGGFVDLQYQDRPDRLHQYGFGENISLNRRLASISTYTHGKELLQTYRLGYQNDGFRQLSRLNEFSVCSNEDVCTKPLEFTWQAGGEPGLTSAQWSAHSSASSGHRTWVGDFNGDGISDFAFASDRERIGESDFYDFYGRQMHMSLSSSDGFANQDWAASGVNPSKTFGGDFNGDGLEDLASVALGGESVSVNLSTGAGFQVEHWSTSNEWSSSSSNWIWAADFNADGLTDLASATGDKVYIKFSTGSGFRSETWSVLPNWGQWQNTWLGDFNGDGLPDIASASGTNVNMKLSTGNGFRSEVWTVPAHWSDTGYNWSGDFNGDGLADIAAAINNRVFVKLSTGEGFEQESWWVNEKWGEAKYTKAVDINGDGFSDILSARGGSVYVKLANGQGFDMIAWPVSSQWGDASMTRVGDFNGDGMADIASIESGGRANMKLGQHRISTMIDSTTDVSGNVTRLTYSPLTDNTVYTKGTGAAYPVVDLQFPQYVVSEVNSDNGVGGTNTIRYRYHGLKANSRGRGQLGFRKITTLYPQTDKEETSYFKFGNYPQIGVLEKLEERYNGQLLNQQVNRYVTRHNGGVYELFMDKSVERSWELDAPYTPTAIVTTWNQHYDEYGNPGRVVVSTKGGAQEFRKRTDSVYVNDTANWHLGRLTRSITTHTSPDQPDKRRRVEFTYNDMGLLAEEIVVNAVKPGERLIRTATIYNSFGQKVQVSIHSPGEQPRVTTSGYDSRFRLQKACNTYNECSTTSYDNKSRVASVTGPNDLTTSFTYDSFGRVIREDRADGTWSTTRTRFARWCQPNGGEVLENAYTCVITQSKGSPVSVVQFDRLARKIRTVNVGFDDRLVYSDTKYDAQGRVARVSRDYYMGDYVYWATSEYDVLDRVIRAVQPGPHSIDTEIITEYDGLTTTVYNGPERRAKITIKDLLGNTIRVEEPQNTFMDYTYTSDGNLKTTTSNGNDATTITLNYDAYGRKVNTRDPGLGYWSYEYNGFGDLIRQVDAKGQEATLEYDRLGRLIRRFEPEGVSTWVYGRNSGDSIASAGSIGQLLREQAPGITKNFSYDHLGRAESVTTTIGEDSFTVETRYDALGRVKRTTYPGDSGFFTENVYNDNGYLKAVWGLRRHSQPHDYDALKPLIAEATEIADGYLAKANQLKNLGEFYQRQITYYQQLAANPPSAIVSIGNNLDTRLLNHAGTLNNTINQGRWASAEFLGHMNHAIAELEAVTALINSQYNSYQDIAEQLVTLAAQTLAAADHNFSYQRTYASASDYYEYGLDENSNHITYWRAADVDASGRIRAEVYGNGIVNDYTYNQGTGHLEALNSSVLTLDSLRHLEYTYDTYDNVTLRHDMVNDLRETYEYDNLDRLRFSHVSSDLYEANAFNSTQEVRYNRLGNITYKSDVGNYHYGNNAGPHAVTHAGGNTYTYDANGNMISGAGRTIQWNSNNKAIYITEDGRSASFEYGVDRARFRKLNHQGDTTLYIGGLYEEVRKASGVTEQMHTIFAGSNAIAEHVISSEQGTHIRYLHKDALGSIDLVTDAQANVVDRRSFDVWGKLRDLPWRAQASLDDPMYLTQLPFTNKGYTGHEHVQEVELIHMNGRMYDATLARFISADPHIQSPGMTQNYNRYSYVMNNPLKYSDPSGFFFKKLFNAVKGVAKDFVKSIPGKVAAFGIMYVCPHCGILAMAVMSTVDAAISGGNILVAFIAGGITAGAADAAGQNEVFDMLDVSAGGFTFESANAAAHGFISGVTTAAQGGKFGAAFKSSFFTKLVSSPIEVMSGKVDSSKAIVSKIVGSTTAALVGGTVAEISGGKFANGARTAAIQYLFNQISGELTKEAKAHINKYTNANITSKTANKLFQQFKHGDKVLGIPSYDELSSMFEGLSGDIPPLYLAMAEAAATHGNFNNGSPEDVSNTSVYLQDAKTGRSYFFDLETYSNKGYAPLIETGVHSLEGLNGSYGGTYFLRTPFVFPDELM